MKLNFEEYIIDIAERVSTELGNVLDVSTTRWIKRPIEKEQFKDATLAFYVDGKRRTNDVVLLISNYYFPDVVEADVARAREIALRVSQHVGRHIAAPICEGKYGNQTYATFSRLSSLSDFRLIRLFQKNNAAKIILPWLIDLAKETKEERGAPDEYENYFVHPLVTLCNDKLVSADVRNLASEYLEFVHNRKTELFTVVQHGDFWIGNVFFERRILPEINPTLGEFSVVDWRGSSLDGYPCIDFLRLCSSMFNIGSARNKELLAQYLDALEISQDEFRLYCLLALGRLGAELDQFPKEIYLRLCDRTSEFIKAHSY